MDLGLKDKVVVCMSSASGFGKGIATEFAHEGAKVVVCTSEAFKAELNQAVVDIEKETGNRPYPYMYDVLNNESIAAMINKVAEDLGGIYGLVNHCPGPKAGTFEALTEADWADGYQKCLYSYTTAIRAALPYMKQGGGGRIVNSTSSSIKQELDNLILSNTFRMGVVGMSKTMAREFGPYNIMVNTMGPGRIYTLEEYNTRDAASFPQKRYQTADEYARSVVFICSPANSAISGQVICVDGAMTTAY